jgi:hypothetical protein
MSNLKEIKKQLEEITNAVNTLDSNDTKNSKAICVTKKQLKDMINCAILNLVDEVKQAIKDVTLDIDENIDVEIIGREIELNIDTYQILYEISDSVTDNITTKLEDNDVDALIEQFIK